MGSNIDLDRRLAKFIICGEDPLSAARGIFNGLLICIPFWILIAYLIWG